MGFARLSNAVIYNSYVMLEQIFIVEYMPYAPESYTKVYLYGLSLACRESSTDNALEKLAGMLSLEPATVIEAYKYWENEGLVRCIFCQETEIEYLPVRAAADRIIKFKPEKYENFNKQLNAALPERAILPNEFHEYYTIMEALHIDEAGMIEIVGYCTRRKGMNIGYPYIISVARNLANEGKTSYDAIHNALVEAETRDPKILDLFKKLGIKRKPDYEDAGLYKKWSMQFGFSESAILYAAAKCKRKSDAMSYLNTVLTGYHERKITTQAEMEEYDSRRDSMYALANRINYYLGAKYDSVSYLVDHYIVDWHSLGFDEKSILRAAEQLPKRTDRTWEALNALMHSFYEQGIVSTTSVDKYYEEMKQADIRLAQLFKEAGVTETISPRARDCYRTWTYTWGFKDDVLSYAASLANGKLSPLPYMNTVLAGWHREGVCTLEQATAASQRFEAAANPMPPPLPLMDDEAADNRAFSQALENPQFLAIETTIRTLELELAKNPCAATEKELKSAHRKREKLLREMGIALRG